ncbi:hypothetical protein WSS15_08250 [Acetobacter pasteurianus]|uniref:Uncharacterized protein n=4 Tax=Acetobacter pasteurianus TaxID=438 RepID=C7JG42_ACEP3|nr:hypothetical protein [Acetobacter pasteurianus]BAU39584.1 hypothetical protein APT_02502 [Acetobacter pasteurianus NBRC 101655]ASC05829.1 hypothetical protein S101468_01583 [Acetobacter pasteurianus subsp. pasteurianus]OAZ72225.1 hypothetical protein SRCM100623_01857 [Acetobacter pasteurianus]QHM91625.1 hypothetical protein FCN51_08740 [Acetobacter pasteurianus]CCT59406.1 hypothetical protein APA386B_1317 [Acetobacter pasteurianus 386B]
MHKEPEPAWKPQPQPQAADKPSGVRMALIGLATCVIMAGAGVHFMGGGHGNTATPAAENNTQDHDNSANRMGIPLTLIASQKAAQTLAKSNYTDQEQADILAGIKRRDIRLVAMPVYDATGAGGTITLICGAWHQTVHLSPTPQTVILPITISGNVDIIPASDPGPAGIGSGAITVFGPQTLPIMYKGDTLPLTVIAQ